MENRVTELLDLERCRPPEAPIDMPCQALERQKPQERSWLDMLRHLAARQPARE